MKRSTRSRRRAFAFAFSTAASVALTSAAAFADSATACSSVASTADGANPAAPACTVNKRQAMLEFGYDNTSVGGQAGFGVTSYPSATLRYGVANALEFDVNGAPYQRVRVGDAVAHGYGDMGAGLRYRVVDTGRFAVSALGNVTLPTGDAAFTAGKSQYALGAAAAYALTPKLAVQSSVNYASQYTGAAFGTPTWFASYNPAVAIVANASPGTSFYVGGDGQTKVAPGLGPQYGLDAGVRKQLGQSAVLDLGANEGITSVEGQRAHGVRVAFSQLIK